MNLKEITWEQLVADETPDKEPGKVYADWYEDGIRCLIMRGPIGLCAYIGVPEGHPLAGFDYDDLPLSCHGGLTFSSMGDGHYRPKGFYWYGWDYSHSGDYAFYYDKEPLKELGAHHQDDRKWLPHEVEQEIKSVLWEFKKLVTLAEKIKN